VRLDDIPGALLTKFNSVEFRDIFYPISFAALALLIAAVVLYNVQTRRLHRHPPLVALQEWLLWTGISVFGLILVCAIFSFYFLLVIGTIVVGCATFIWIRFVRFPPLIAGYNQQLRRARFYSQQRYKTAEATVRTRKSAASGGKRRRRR
jgi:small-conductance mechanosensitive channel